MIKKALRKWLEIDVLESDVNFLDLKIDQNADITTKKTKIADAFDRRLFNLEEAVGLYVPETLHPMHKIERPPTNFRPEPVIRLSPGPSDYVEKLKGYDVT